MKHELALDELAKRAKNCEAHHYACDCREYEFARVQMENLRLMALILDYLDATVALSKSAREGIGDNHE